MSWYQSEEQAGFPKDYRAPSGILTILKKERMEVSEKSLAEIALRIPGFKQAQFEPSRQSVQWVA